MACGYISASSIFRETLEILSLVVDSLVGVVSFRNLNFGEHIVISVSICAEVKFCIEIVLFYCVHT